MNDKTHARYMADIAYFLSKMEEEPDSNYILPVLLSYNKLEKYDETISLCEEVLDKFHSNCAFKTFLAEAYVYKGIFDKAKPLLIEVTAEDNDNYKALKLLGIIAKSEGENKEALKYLTGAYIRSPEDEDVKKMIDELGGTLNPSEIYDEKMKRQREIAVVNENDDEHLKVYKEIDSQIKNAEMIVEDLMKDKVFHDPEYFQGDDYADTEENMGEKTENFQAPKDFKDDDFLEIKENIEIAENIIEDIEEEININDGIREIKEIKGINVFIENNIKEEEKEEKEEVKVEEIAEEIDKENISSENSKIEDNKISDLIASLSSQDLEEEIKEVVKEDNIENNATFDLISALSSEEEEEQEEAVELAENMEVEVAEKNSGESLAEDLENQPENLVSIHNMSYEDIIDDDFQYGKIVDDDYTDEDISSHDDLGESAPFTQREIMDEILTAANISPEDIEKDEKIEIVRKKEKEDKEAKINRLGNFLDKVTHAKD